MNREEAKFNLIDMAIRILTHDKKKNFTAKDVIEVATEIEKYIKG